MNSAELNEQIRASLGAAAKWSLDFKKSESELFNKASFTPKEREAYRFTNIEKFLSQSHEINSISRQYPKSELHFVNGVLVGSDPHLHGVTIFPIQEKWNEILATLEKEENLSHLHHALLSGGVYIEVDKRVDPLTVLTINYTHSNTLIAAPLVFIHMKVHAAMTILENHELDATQMSETYIKLEANARLEHIQVIDNEVAGIQHARTQVELDKDANYKNILLHLAGAMNRSNLLIHLNKPGAHAESFALYLTCQNEHSDLSTQIIHHAEDSTSAQIAKGILDHESKAIFAGKIHIHPKAQRVQSSQLNKNLLLSNKAQSHSLPQLEIFADDVKCSHGSTTGQLSADEVFYFQARGIPKERATTLLAHGFGLEIVDKIKHPLIKQRASDLVLTKLKEKFKIGKAL